LSAALDVALDVARDLALDVARDRRKSKSANRSVRSTPLSMVAIKNSPNGATLAVKVHPRAKKNAITGETGDVLKLALTAAPADGKGNEACIDFFAKLLKLPRSSITIAAGETSRNKVIRVAGVSAEEVRRLLKIPN
jgi:uncharacterized protein